MSNKVRQDDARACGVLKFVSDDWLTWHFQSTDDPEISHTVHLDENDCSGACSCQNFDFTIRPLLRDRVIKKHSERSKCKHIRRAEKILCYRFKKNLVALFKQSENPNPK